MMAPGTNEKVPASTPSEDHPMPLSKLETATARPNAPVSEAVRLSRTRGEHIKRSVHVYSLDEPTLLGGDLLDMLEVLFDEVVEICTGQEGVDLRGLLDIVLPLRRCLHFLHEVDIVGGLIRADLARQPYRARLLKLANIESLLDAGRDIAPAFGRGDFRTRRQPL